MNSKGFFVCAYLHPKLKNTHMRKNKSPPGTVTETKLKEAGILFYDINTIEK